MTRRRQRKRLTRMDAALDAMALLGFPEEKVKKRVKELLRVYGGDDGWPFIEDSAYKELIEALLCDDDEENDEEKGTDDCCSSKDKCIEDDIAAPGASSRVSGRSQDEKPKNITSIDTAESSPAVAEPPESKSVSGSSCLSTVHDGVPTKGGDDVWKDILLHHPSRDAKKTGSTGNKSGKETTSPVKNPIPASSLPSSNISHPGSDLPLRWRLPCYGWIQSDEEDDLGGFTKLTPAPGQFGPMLAPPCTTSLSINSRSKKKRRSRWDVKPWDPY